MGTSRANWKQNDIEISKDHNEKHEAMRTPFSGGNSKLTRGDVIHPILYIECKKSSKHLIPPSPEKLIDDTIKKASKELIEPEKQFSKIPVLVLTKGQGPGKPKKRIVLLQYNDYLRMMKPEYRFGLKENLDMSEFEEEVEDE